MSGEMAIDNSKISLFSDFSAELQKQRAKFTDVKKRLRDLNLPYAMLYPAQLRVVALGKSHFFDLPTSAGQWLDQEDRALKTAKSQRNAPTWKMVPRLFGGCPFLLPFHCCWSTVLTI